MTAAGVLRLFRTKPQQPIGADGRMALADHLRELRARLLLVTLALTIGIIVAWFFYDQLFNLLLDPYEAARRRLAEKGVRSEPVVNGVATSLLLRLKISALAAVVVTSPFWLYQVWGFVVPGLHPHEKKWTQLFAVVAGPLFVAGVAVAYYVLPKGMEVLIGFTPGNLTSLIDFGDYFRFLTRMMLVFGIAFEIPLFVVMLNLAGVVSGRTLGAYRPWIILGTFIFAAVATPSTDPFSMIMLAIPMTVLFLLSEGIARFVDRRRAARSDSFGDVADDEASPLDLPDDVRRSRLDEARPVTAPPEVRAVDPFDLPDWLGLGRGDLDRAHQRARRAPRRGRAVGRRRLARLRPARGRPGVPGAGARRRLAAADPPGVDPRPGAARRLRRPAHPGGARHRLHRGPGAGGRRPSRQGRRRQAGPFRGGAAPVADTGGGSPDSRACSSTLTGCEFWSPAAPATSGPTRSST